MNRTTIVFATVLLAAIALARPCVAGGTSGTVVSVDAEKVVIQLDHGKGAAFPVGMRDVEIKESGTVCARGRIVASNKDRITIKVVRGKTARLREGSGVQIGQAADAGAEGIDGC